MSLEQCIELAWRSFDHLSNRPWVAKPSIPIVFFGDLNRYQSSPLRIVTVGLNPSLHEFPQNDPFVRFPVLKDTDGRDPTDYCIAMSNYFQIEPYSPWFNRSFESMLNGLGASFYDKFESTAVHTDICSSIATLRTWSRLNAAEKNELEEEGVRIWHDLVAALKPHLVLISVAKHHLAKINFVKLEEWKTVLTFDKTAKGATRKTPYKIESASFSVVNSESKFIFGKAAQTPFGLLGKEQAIAAGQFITELVSL